MFSNELKEQANDFRLIGSPPFPQSVFVESHRIDECVNYARQKYSGRIAIYPLGMGFELSNLSFLLRFPWIEHLTIQNSDMVDISAVSSLQDLRYLSISGKPKQALSLSEFPELVELRIDWWPKLILGDVLPKLRVLDMSWYASPTRDLTALPSMPTLEEFSLVQSRHLALSGIERLRNSLRKIGISYFADLVDLFPLTAFGESGLEILEFANCPNLKNHQLVSNLKSLRRLAFNRCGEIPNLRFLDDLPALESFSFVGTNVVDGDLTPCLRLQFAGFLNKRHYSHRTSDFPPPSSPTVLRERG